MGEEEMEEENKEEMADPNTARSKSTSEQLEPESPGVPGAGGALATEGESGRRVPSEESSLEPDGSHTVTCTFTVSLAVPVLATSMYLMQTFLGNLFHYSLAFVAVFSGLRR